jgi:putative radical SAM enzyme (TIGR03279 family)
MPVPRVVAVAPGSPADRAGIRPGDELLTLNGEVPRDVIRYRLLADEPVVDVEVRRGGLEQTITLAKRAGEPLGAEVQSAVFDRVQTCDNHCPFCFIYQLPPGMRRSLSLKDDDYRLSFLYGNFTTLTRFTEADLERIVDEGLSPLYVSIHATDPDLRARLLRNQRGATSLRWLRLLLDHGVEVHGQVVVCPGVNDAAALDDTLLGVLDRFPELASVCVVPLGVSAYNREPDMRVHTPAEAMMVCDLVTRWQARFLAVLGRRMVFLGDEYYLMAGRAFPDAGEYEGFPQHENGVGMARVFDQEVRAAAAGEARGGTGPRAGFFAAVDRAVVPVPGGPTGCWQAVPGAPAEGYRAPRTDHVPVTLRAPRSASVGLITGEYGARVLAPLLPALSDVAGAPVRTVTVGNRFFGGNIAVTGLVTGADVGAVLASEPPGERYLLPDVALSHGVFLDGTSPADLPRPVEVVPTDGVALVAALRR